jgi:hypothetical protein
MALAHGGFSRDDDPWIVGRELGPESPDTRIPTTEERQHGFTGPITHLPAKR